jgi:hypothetical protein
MENFRYLGSENVIPEEFSVVGYAYSEMVEDAHGIDFDAIIDLDADVPKEVEDDLIGMVHNKTNCNHCNKVIRYLVVAQDEKSEAYHVFGSTCGTDLRDFNMGRVDGIKGRTLLKRKKEKLARERAKMAEKAEKFLDENDGLREALELDHHITKDLKSNLYKWGNMSEKQIALAHKLVEGAKKYAKMVEERQEEMKDAQPVEEGRLKKVEMTIVSTKSKTYSSEWETTTKTAMTMTHPDGWRVWGCVRYDDELMSLESGSKILFSGTVTKSDKDDKFGFFKRGIAHEILDKVSINHESIENS